MRNLIILYDPLEEVHLCWRAWFSDGFNSAGLLVGFYDLSSAFQSK